MALALAGSTLAAALTAAPAAHADAWRDKEYWLAESGITKAWEVSKGANVKVAVIDSGVDGKHPDLAGVLAGGVDVSGAGSPDGQKSIGAKPEHGTLVATMLAGRGHQPAHSTAKPSPSAGPSVARTESSGWPPKRSCCLSRRGSDPRTPAARATRTRYPRPSAGRSTTGPRHQHLAGQHLAGMAASWDAAFLYAEQKDVVIVAAAGNRGGGNVQVGAPATIPGVLTVAGLDRKGTASIDSSSQGISIAVAAPAENLIGGLPGGGYAEWAGTSGATPIVAGVAALIRSKWPEMSASQVINRIVSTANDAGAPGKDPLYGFGILDAEAASRPTCRTVDPPGSISTGSGSTGGATWPPPAAPSAVPPARRPPAGGHRPVAEPPSGSTSPAGLVVLGFGDVPVHRGAAGSSSGVPCARPLRGPTARHPGHRGLDSADSSGKP